MLINEVRKDLIKIISSSNLVQEVSNFPKTTFKGYPAVAVTFNGIENVIASNMENERVLTFGIHIFDQCGNELDNDNAISGAETNIADVVSDLLDKFDDTYDLNGSTAVDFQLPVSTDEPTFVEMSAGWARKVTLFLTIHKRFNT